MYEGGNRVCIVDFSLGEKSLRKVGVCRRRERVVCEVAKLALLVSWHLETDMATVMEVMMMRSRVPLELETERYYHVNA